MSFWKADNSGKDFKVTLAIVNYHMYSYHISKPISIIHLQHAMICNTTHAQHTYIHCILLVITVTIADLPLPAGLLACTVIIYEVLLVNPVNAMNVLLIIVIVPSDGNIVAWYLDEPHDGGSDDRETVMVLVLASTFNIVGGLNASVKEHTKMKYINE